MCEMLMPIPVSDLTAPTGELGFNTTCYPRHPATSASRPLTTPPFRHPNPSLPHHPAISLVAFLENGLKGWAVDSLVEVSENLADAIDR